MASTSNSNRSRSSNSKSTTRRRNGGNEPQGANTLAEDARTAVRSVRTRASRAVKNVPTDRTSVSIAAGVIAGLAAAGVAIFMNRARLRQAAAASSDRLKKAADDLSTRAHERIDQARDNITRLRSRGSETENAGNEPVAISG